MVRDPRAKFTTLRLCRSSNIAGMPARAGLGYLAGLFFEPLRESLIARSDFAHCLLGLSVLHDFCLGQDFLGARSQVSGE